MSIGIVWEDLYTRHNMGEMHPESPGRLLAVKDVIEDPKLAMAFFHITPRPATKEEISWVHDIAYIEKIEKTKGKHVVLDPDTSTSPETYDAALLAAGGVIACVDYVMNGGGTAFAFVRPPGHHAERNKAMGFCFFNNIAVAAEYALKKCGIKKLAILDFDVHHGNGTQNHFYERSDVIFASTHRSPFYPGTGSINENGRGHGEGFTLNVPLRSGAGDEEFKNAWGNKILPHVEHFAPELILVSAGFDAHENDPLGGMKVTTATYGWLARELGKIAKRTAKGRLVYVLEGGYSLSAVRSSVRAMIEEML